VKIEKSEIYKIISRISKKKITNDNQLKSYLLDSLAMMKIIIELEKFYKIQIIKNIKRTSFNTIENITKLINDNKKPNKK
jgi:acyl carrier protein